MNTVAPPASSNINTSTSALQARLDSNNRFSAVDFQTWLFERLAPRAGMDVLDVGCGTGAQSLRLLDAVGAQGSVSALDLSAASVEGLVAKAAGRGKLQAVVSGMDDLGKVIAGQFAVKQYDLAQSTYALYYAADPVRVLDAMRAALKPDGRLAVCVPNHPHGLVELIRRFGPIPKPVDDCNFFPVQVLDPYFRRHFVQVTVHLLRNTQRVPSVEEVMVFLRNAAYFNPATADQVAAAVAEEIARHGYFTYDKHSYLIIGCNSDAG
ncbi:class I SAM-dependent methyltransferase [Ferrovibrio sp.]|uniref:class I SAM-dependent methyltransferase n=1 Tax=Ferrovibrio sp. TaxID=1917215 RepID=UPI003D279D8D